MDYYYYYYYHSIIPTIIIIIYIHKYYYHHYHYYHNILLSTSGSPRAPPGQELAPDGRAVRDLISQILFSCFVPAPMRWVGSLIRKQVCAHAI